MLTESYSKGAEYPELSDLTLGQLLHQAAHKCPDRAAIIAGVADPSLRREISYAELDAQADHIAKALLGKFKVGQHIAVMAPNIPEWIVLEFASARAGLVLVTVNPSFQEDEIAYVLNQSDSVGVFAMSNFRGNPILELVSSACQQCPNIQEIICFDDWPVLIDQGKQSAVELPQVKADDVCMIQYTSGTTGFPKGVLLHHRGLVNNAAHTALIGGAKPGSMAISALPLFHTGGCVLGVLGSIFSGDTQVLVEMFEPALMLELIETYKINTMGGVPTMLVAMIEHPDRATRDLSSMQRLSSGGSTVPVDLVKRIESELGATFVIVFGQTECSPVACMTRPDDDPEDKANTIGVSMPHTETKIIDPENGKTVAIGEKGEFCTRGYHVMKGYYNNAEASAETLDEQGWLHTGDLCSMDERGYCKVEGRLKDMIIRGGENIYPKEIENLLFEHESVGEVAVVGLPDDLMGEVVGAFIRAAPGHEISRSELFAYLRENLSPQKTPSLWFEVEQFPLTGSGKIQKFQLVEDWQSDELVEL